MSLPEVEVDLALTTLVEVEAPAEAALVEVPGPPGPWAQLTQAEFDALSPPDPNTLYVIVG